MSTQYPSVLDTFINPTENDKLNGNPNPALTHVSQHANINDAMAAIQAKVGVDLSNVVNSIDYKLQILFMTLETHNLGLYKEVSGGTRAFPTNKIWYKDATKLIKLLEKVITYQNGRKIPEQIVYKLYNGTSSNILVRTVTDTPEYFESTPFEKSITRVII